MFLCLLFLCHSTPPPHTQFIACKAQSFLKTSTYFLSFKSFRESRNNLKAILFSIKNIFILPSERREVALKQRLLSIPDSLGRMITMKQKGRHGKTREELWVWALLHWLGIWLVVENKLRNDYDNGLFNMDAEEINGDSLSKWNSERQLINLRHFWGAMRNYLVIKCILCFSVNDFVVSSVSIELYY